MADFVERTVAVVGVGAILPDAPSAADFWRNIAEKRYSISEVSPERWDPAEYWNPDPAATDKTYSKIGGWVRGFTFDWKRFHIPPKVAGAMDEGQQWAVTIAAEALADYGWPERPLDTERTGVVLGTAMGGELHYLTAFRVLFPEFRKALDAVQEFRDLPEQARRAILGGWMERVQRALPPITEDTMPGELPNIMSGRIANVLNLRGPNFTTDAACASTLAAVEAAVDLLTNGHCDAVLTGGVDRNMGVSSFVKFCKIGALSATGTRPFADGADGFVMGEGCASFLLKRLADAERDGDRVYAVIRGVGGASDGKGKGITAPNPAGQRLAIERAWKSAGLSPTTATLVEAHGTSTKVGDVVEIDSLTAVFGDAPRGSIALGSAKSNVGHLKAGAGAAGLLKAILALHHKQLPPTLNAERPNPSIDFARTPFFLNHELKEWTKGNGTPRRVGVSAYGFGGTNFHIVLEEHVPGALTSRTRETVAVPTGIPRVSSAGATSRATLQGVATVRGRNAAELKAETGRLLSRVKDGALPPSVAPEPAFLAAPERLAIDFEDGPELVRRLESAVKALEAGSPGAFRALAAQGIFRGSGPAAGKVAFLFPGQGSQYVNMGRELAGVENAAAEVFAEADRVILPILGRPLTSYLFADASDTKAMKEAEEALKQTAITQPAMLTTDVAIYESLRAYGFDPELVMGHSLGEYGALIAAGIMPFADALEAAAARGREMTRVSLEDNGLMAAVMAPAETIEEVLARIDGYVALANINSPSQCVIGGTTEAVRRAVAELERRGVTCVVLPVSHAFHTRIVAPASEPLRSVLDRLHVAPPKKRIVSNVTGGLYPERVEEIKDLLQRQIASPVQWVKGLETLWGCGARTFVEVGPKRVLKGFTDGVLGERPGVVSIATGTSKADEIATLNRAICGLWSAGHGAPSPTPIPVVASATNAPPVGPIAPSLPSAVTTAPPEETVSQTELLKDTLARTLRALTLAPAARFDRNETPLGSIVISGTGLGLPGAEKSVMDPSNTERILRGEQFVDLVPERFRRQMRDKKITRVVKSEDGSGRFETIEDTADVIKLAGRPGTFDLEKEYGVPAKLIEALDTTSQLAIAAGLDALREAEIPLVRTWKKTTKGTHLPDRWMLPEPLRDETGVIFASAFPGYNRFADEMGRFYEDAALRRERAVLESLRAVTGDSATLSEIARKVAELDEKIVRLAYAFDRRFLMRVLSMGHSQFAEYVGARGPNTQVNSACASSALAISLAEDWIRAGRCRRVVVLGADNVTSDALLPWIGAGFLASGAAATDDKVDEAALPFDRRRHGTLVGMGACALVVESQDAIEERGMRGLVEVLSSEGRNSAFHGTRLDVDHIAQVVESLVRSAERRFGIDRRTMAAQTVFMSHETFTPARGGSASAEVVALRQVFGPAANDIVIANTKGFTGHPMGVGIEDVIAVKILEHGIVPPVPNFKEVDPELGPLNLSRGGRYPLIYAVHLAAGFGSQIALTLTRRIPGGLERTDDRALYRRWLADVSGDDQAELEVVTRNLRVVSREAPVRPPVPSRWVWGTGPVRRAPAPGTTPAPRVTPDVVRIPEKPAATPPPPIESVSRPPETATAPLANPPPPAATPAEDPIVTRVLAIVAEKTGYPPEMLDLDLDLEADLGVDTVKQAETFAAVRAEWNIARQENLKLRDFPTIHHVVKFVRDMRPDLAPASVPGSPIARPVPVPEPVLAAVSAAASVSVPSPAPAGAAKSVESDPVVTKVLSIVAEKTGYPPEMLDLDLDLEADLGVDTVKQAETFAAVRAEWSIPRQESLKLRDFPTIRHVVGFVLERTSLRALSTAPIEEVVRPFDFSAPSIAAPVAPRAARLEDADRVPRRVPIPSIRPAASLMKPTGVALERGGRVVVAGEGDVAKELEALLVGRGVEVLALPASLSSAALESKLLEWTKNGPIAGVYWLPALEVEPSLFDLDLAAFREANRVRVKNLYATMRALRNAVTARGTFLVSATRMGGRHGQGAAAASAPLGGGVAGFTKAYKRERPDALVKVVDVEAAAAPAEVARSLVDETLFDPGLVEVGRHEGLRLGVSLEARPAVDGGAGLALTQSTVFVVTGAAGGITSAIVSDLAAASGGVFWLLDLVSTPERSDPKIALFRADREGLKKVLIDEARARGERPTPVMIDKSLLGIERLDAALRAVEAVEAAGGTAFYRSVSLLDGPALTAVVEEIRSRHGRIDVLVHAGGVEISRKLEDKEPGEFDLVFDIKADGFFTLLKATEGMPLAATVVFSSVAGRFGNSGQTDYSAANALLCSMSSWLRAARPGIRTIAVDWTAWGGIGMATRGSIPKIMEMAGIDMLPPEVGIPTIRRELTAGGFSGEIVVGKRLGILVAEWDETGGLDPARAAEELAAHKQPLVMVGKIVSAPLYEGLNVETTLDPKVQPFLFDHAMEGTPLLPGVMGTEAFAELASVLCPDWKVAAVEDEEFLAPFKFHRMQPATLCLSARGVPENGDGDVLVETILKSRVRPKLELPAVERVHFRARVRMTRRAPPAPKLAFAPPFRKEPLPVGPETIYRIYFHGPAYKVLDGVKLESLKAFGLMAEGLPPDAAPLHAEALMAPRLIELCFQTAGIWEVGTHHRLALPMALGSVRVFRREKAATSRLWATVTAREDGAYDADVVDEQGNVFVELRRYRTIPLEGTVTL